MTSKLSLVDIETKIRLPRRISDIDSFRAYGSNEAIISNYSYLGHFLVVINQLGAVNYALFRRCAQTGRIEADREYFSSTSEIEQREKARSAILSKIAESPDLHSAIYAEINYCYDSINVFFEGLAAEKFGGAGHIKNPQLCESIFGSPCLENYEKNIAELQMKTASVYVLLQQLSDIYDKIASHYDWTDEIDTPYS